MPEMLMNRSHAPKQSVPQWAKGCSVAVIIGGILVLLGLGIAFQNIGNGIQATHTPPPASTHPSTPSSQISSTGAISTTTPAKATVAPTYTVPTPTVQLQPTQQPQPTPTLQPTPQPTPTPEACPDAVNRNPWCFDFHAAGGHVILFPPSGFCHYF